MKKIVHFFILFLSLLVFGSASLTCAAAGPDEVADPSRIIDSASFSKVTTINSLPENVKIDSTTRFDSIVEPNMTNLTTNDTTNHPTEKEPSPSDLPNDVTDGAIAEESTAKTIVTTDEPEAPDTINTTTTADTASTINSTATTDTIDTIGIADIAEDDTVTTTEATETTDVAKSADVTDTANTTNSTATTALPEKPSADNVGVIDHSQSPTTAQTYVTADDIVTLVADRTHLTPDLDVLSEAGHITGPEKTVLEQQQYFSRAMIWRILLPTFDLYPYPSDLYPDIPAYDQNLSRSYANARTALISCGLVDPSDNPYAAMTSTELTKLADSLENAVLPNPIPELTMKPVTLVSESATNTTTTPESTAKPTTTIPKSSIEPTVTISESTIKPSSTTTWNSETYKGRNSLMSAYNQIPTAWLTDFKEQDWQISFERYTGSISQNGKILTGQDISGLTSYREKTIYLNYENPRTTLHEFTHYAANRVGWNQAQLDAVFYAEREQASRFLRSYAQTNSSEYLAEFTSFYILTDDFHRRNLLHYAPKTTLLAETLINNFDQLLRPTLVVA